jgi:hypothetical protein
VLLIKLFRKGKVANLADLTGLLTKQLRPKMRAKPTDAFAEGCEKVTKSFGLLQIMYFCFKLLKMPELDGKVTGFVWEVFDAV